MNIDENTAKPLTGVLRLVLIWTVHCDFDRCYLIPKTRLPLEPLDDPIYPGIVRHARIQSRHEESDAHIIHLAREREQSTKVSAAEIRNLSMQGACNIASGLVRRSRLSFSGTVLALDPLLRREWSVIYTRSRQLSF